MKRVLRGRRGCEDGVKRGKRVWRGGKRVWRGGRGCGDMEEGVEMGKRVWRWGRVREEGEECVKRGKSA